MSEVTVYGVKAGSGEHVYHPIPVTHMANGTMMCVPLHIVNGMRPGPKIMLSALSHGDATTGLEIIRQVLESVDVERLWLSPARILLPLSGIPAIRRLMTTI